MPFIINHKGNDHFKDWLNQIQKMSATVVRVRVRSAVVVHVEKPVVQVLVIVAPDVQARVRRVKVPVIARISTECPRHAQEAPIVPLMKYVFYKRGRSPSLGWRPNSPPLREFKKSATEVRARARSAVVEHVEKPAAQALDIVAPDEQARVRRAKAPVIARISAIATACCSRNK